MVKRVIEDRGNPTWPNKLDIRHNISLINYLNGGNITGIAINQPNNHDCLGKAAAELARSIVSQRYDGQA